MQQIFLISLLNAFVHLTKTTDLEKKRNFNPLNHPMAYVRNENYSIKTRRYSNGIRQFLSPGVRSRQKILGPKCITPIVARHKHCQQQKNPPYFKELAGLLHATHRCKKELHPSAPAQLAHDLGLHLKLEQDLCCSGFIYFLQ